MAHITPAEPAPDSSRLQRPTQVVRDFKPKCLRVGVRPDRGPAGENHHGPTVLFSPFFARTAVDVFTSSSVPGTHGRWNPKPHRGDDMRGIAVGAGMLGIAGQLPKQAGAVGDPDFAAAAAEAPYSHSHTPRPPG